MEDARPPVTVVIPTRDRPDLLVRAVAAVVEQRYRGPIECLVVFDQSPVRQDVAGLSRDTDGPRSVRGIANVRSPGLAGARNSGIVAATGALIAFCDDDDEWLPDRLERQVEALAAAPEHDVATCGILVCYEGKERPRVPDRDRFTLADFLRDRHTEVHPSTMLARREAVLERIGLVDESLPGSYAEDYEWLLRAARSAPIVAVREPLVRVHWHRSSYFEGRWGTIADALECLIGRYPEFAGEPRGLARVHGQIAFARAAGGRAGEARRWARSALRLHAGERRAYLALAVGAKVISASTVLRLAHLTGRGI